LPANPTESGNQPVDIIRAHQACTLIKQGVLDVGDASGVVLFSNFLCWGIEQLPLSAQPLCSVSFCLSRVYQISVDLAHSQDNKSSSRRVSSQPLPATFMNKGIADLFLKRLIAPALGVPMRAQYYLLTLFSPNVK